MSEWRQCLIQRAKQAVYQSAQKTTYFNIHWLISAVSSPAEANMKFMYCDQAVYFILLLKLRMFGATIGLRVASLPSVAQLTFALELLFVPTTRTLIFHTWSPTLIFRTRTSNIRDTMISCSYFIIGKVVKYISQKNYFY